MVGSDSCLSQAGLCGLHKLLLTPLASHSSFQAARDVLAGGSESFAVQTVRGWLLTLPAFFIPSWLPSQKRESSKLGQVERAELHV